MTDGGLLERAGGNQLPLRRRQKSARGERWRRDTKDGCGRRASCGCRASCGRSCGRRARGASRTSGTSSRHRRSSIQAQSQTVTASVTPRDGARHLAHRCKLSSFARNRQHAALRSLHRRFSVCYRPRDGWAKCFQRFCGTRRLLAIYGNIPHTVQASPSRIQNRT